MVLSRRRLFDTIQSGTDRANLWISGPPGAGKTTAIASFIEAHSRAALWYQLDGADADVATFYYYLRQTALKHSATSKPVLPELPVGNAEWTSYGQQLFRAIFSRFAEPLLIVFDNYESVPPTSDLHGVLAAAIDEVPAGSALVFVSRDPPPAPFARNVANGRLLCVDGDDLKLTTEECGEIATLRGATLPSEAIADIHHASAGWVTGAILMLEHARREQARALHGLPDPVVLLDHDDVVAMGRELARHGATHGSTSHHQDVVHEFRHA